MNRFDRNRRLWFFFETLTYCTLILVGVGGCALIGDNPVGQFLDPNPPPYRTYKQKFKYNGKNGVVNTIKVQDQGSQRVDWEVFDEAGNRIPLESDNSPISPTGEPKVPGVRWGAAAQQNIPERFYVLDTLSDPRILAISLGTYELVQEYFLPPVPEAVSIGRFDLTDDGTLLWAAVSESPRSDFGTPTVRPRLVSIDTTSGATTKSYELPFGSNVRDVEVSPDGRTVYVLDIGIVDREFEGPGVRLMGSEIFAIDAASGEIVSRLEPLEPSSHFEHLAITPDGEMLFAFQAPRGAEGKSAILIFETAEHSRIDEIETRVQIEAGAMIVNRTGSALYVLRDSRVIARYSTATWVETAEVRLEPITPITPQYRLNSLALSLDGGSLFVNDETNAVTYRLDAVTLQVLDMLERPADTPPQGSRLVILP